MKQLNARNLPWPVDWVELFGAARPLIVEIGFGNGQYLMHLADENPDANLIGLEISNKSLEKAERQIMRQERHNIRVIHTPAETALYHLFEPASIGALHINYPDPWFKKRHSGRRLMQRDTLDAMVSRLQPGAKLHLATDIAAYAEMSHELLSDTPGLTNTLSEPWVHHLPGRFTTKYEMKGLREGRPGHYFIYVRNDHPAPEIPVYKEFEMPHAILETSLQPSEMLARFEQSHASFDDIHVTIIAAYLNHNGKVMLFEANVSEPTISQHIGLMLVERERSGEYILRLNSIGNPRPTYGLHRATAYLAGWLVGLDERARILALKVRE